jgi:hypothetical protein
LGSSPHRFAAGAVSVLLLITLVLSACVACAQPVVTKSASAHPCCDPDGKCKPAPAQMNHAGCEASQALLPDVAWPELSTDSALLPAMSEPVRATAALTLAPAVDSSPPISPLRQSTLLRI